MAGKKFLDLQGLEDYNEKLNKKLDTKYVACLLYTSDAADEL